MIVSADSTLTHPARGWGGIVLPHGRVVGAVQHVIGRLFLRIARLFLPLGTGDFASNGPLLQRSRGRAEDEATCSEASFKTSEESINGWPENGELTAALVTKLLEPRYRTVRHVGRGAVGQVWLVLDKKSLCHRVVKLFRYSSHLQELIGVGARLSMGSAGLIDILGHEKSGDGAFIWYFMPAADDLGGFPDIVPGIYIPCTLEKYMARKKALSVSDCVGIGLELCAALDDLHGNEFVHRDIKPANILRVKGRWQVADIGLMARIGCPKQVGTPGYIPPEGHGQPDGDIYSLGIVLSQMLNGGLRLERAKLEAATMAAEGDRRRLMEVALKATAEASRDRYRSAKALSRKLRKIQRRLEK